MKKIFLPIAIAAALLCGNNASAVIPTWYNYQGVCDKANESITVLFQINNSEGEAVYKETHETTTTANGLFNLHIGEGEFVYGAWPEDFKLTTGQFSLLTFVNGVQVSEAPMGAVPYATVAGSVEGISGEEISTMADDIEYALDNVVSLQEGLRNAANIADVNALAEGLGVTQQDVINLVEGQKGNTAAIAILNQYAEGQAETNETLAMGITQAANGLMEVEGKVEELAEGLNITQEDVMNLTTGVRNNSVDVAHLKQYVEGLQEGQETSALGFTQLNNVVNALAEEVQINADGLSNAESNIISLTEGEHENLVAISKNAADIAALADGLAVTQDDVLNLVEGSKGDHAAIELLNQYVEGLMESSETMATGFTQLSNAIIEIEANVEANAQGLADAENEIISLVEGQKENTVAIALLNQNVANLDEVAANATSDIQGIQERIRSLATVASVEALAEGLSVTEGNVIELTEGLKEANAAVALINENINSHITDYNSLYQMVQENGEAIGKLTERVNALEAAE